LTLDADDGDDGSAGDFYSITLLEDFWREVKRNGINSTLFGDEMTASLPEKIKHKTLRFQRDLTFLEKCAELTNNKTELDFLGKM